MKKYLIDYRPALGSYLDENNIQWEQVRENEIYIYCHDENDLFRIACNYQKWYLEVVERS